MGENRSVFSTSQETDVSPPSIDFRLFSHTDIHHVFAVRQTRIWSRSSTRTKEYPICSRRQFGGGLVRNTLHHVLSIHSSHESPTCISTAVATKVPAPEKVALEKPRLKLSGDVPFGTESKFTKADNLRFCWYGMNDMVIQQEAQLSLQMSGWLFPGTVDRFVSSNTLRFPCRVVPHVDRRTPRLFRSRFLGRCVPLRTQQL